MADILKQLNQNISETPFGRKVFLLLVLAGGLAGTAVLWLWMQKPDFQVLYTHLSSEDAGAVVSKLKEGRVPYQFSDDGSAILIPSDRVHELRLQLASQGLPQGGGIGFEIFDRTTFGTTEFVQKLNYRRALQGELARTISQLTEVSKARVHLVVPERALFSDRQEQARASVVVSLRSGKSLAAGQIQGIIHLVSSSVEGLNPQAVTVVDHRGQILTKTSDEPSPSQMTHSQRDYQRNLEKEMEEKVQTMLERVVGPNKAVVRVSTLLDLRQVELTEEKYNPETQVVRSEQRSQEKLDGSSEPNGASGVPGVLSNVPPGAQTPLQGGATHRNSSQKKNEVINYEISKTVSRIIEPIGTIKQLSVAALIDGTYEITKGNEGETGRKYLPRTEDEMKKLEEIVKKAIGYSPERRDQVEMVNVPLEIHSISDEEAAAPEPALGKFSQWFPIVRPLTGLVLVLLLLLFVIRPVVKALLLPSPAGLPLQNAAPQFPPLPEPAKMALPARDQIVQLAKENPQAAAQMVKKWLKQK